ncbi:MAG: bifunctional glutamate N-acetyltransferase/amino-acid acetyltransferase ArgJ [Syntrophaceae bacterium]
MKLPQGFRFAAVNAGVKSPEATRLDMGLIVCSVPAEAVAVFTRNQVKAAPVQIGIRQSAQGKVRAVLANSGNANACTGEKGIDDAQRLMRCVADNLGINTEEVFPMSTGVVGVPLPLQRMLEKVPELAESLGDDPQGFVTSIMTTDTFAKTANRQVGQATVFGFAKGAGMIAPNMATMLALVLTDARLSRAELDGAVRGCLEKTFNAITVDGDTSTNDTLLVMSSNCLEADKSSIILAIQEVMQELAIKVVSDGEGATKLITITVTGALSDADAGAVARSVANSLLVKTALFGQDPNWGRIMCAIGNSGVRVNEQAVAIMVGGMPFVSDGQEAPGFDEEKGHAALEPREVSIDIDLGSGSGTFRVWTTDMSYKYVEINAAYRT